MERHNLEEYCIGSILLLSNKLQAWGDELTGEITFKQFFLLILLSRISIKKPTVQEISEYVGSSRQNVKKMLEQLREKGYVHITSSIVDARSYEVSLTDKTHDYFERNAVKSASEVNFLFSEVSGEELKITIRTLEMLLGKLGVTMRHKSETTAHG